MFFSIEKAWEVTSCFLFSPFVEDMSVGEAFIPGLFPAFLHGHPQTFSASFSYIIFPQNYQIISCFVFPKPFFFQKKHHFFLWSVFF